MAEIRLPDDPAAPLLGLLGPTASGKSELGAALAQSLGLEVLSLDSMLVYRGLDIGTAKPSLESRARVPHHLIDVADPRQRFDVSRYLELAQAAERDLAARGRRGLYVGGTAFYLRALTHGLFEGPPHDPELRARLELRAAEQGLTALHADLARIDPESARRLHANDRKRVLRALEVFEQSGRPLSEWQRQWRLAGAEAPGRPRVLLGLEPPDLEGRFRPRVEAMLRAGWLAEVAALEAQGAFGPTASMALGYPLARAHLAGQLSLAELLEGTALATRQFARSQRTWLRRYPEIRWAPASCYPAGRADPQALLAWAEEQLGPSLEESQG
jgi:tRNA dimethylallyltransferase